MFVRVTKQDLIDQVLVFDTRTSVYLNKNSKEIKKKWVKSTQLKYKNKGLKLKSMYEYSLHVHPVPRSKMRALWELQYF